MKKTITGLLAVVLLVTWSISLADINEKISFQSIPWLSNEDIVANTISNYVDLGFLSSYLSGEEGVFIKMDEDLHGRPSITKDYADRCLCIVLTGPAESKIAGYDINRIQFTFSNNNTEFQLVCVKVDLKGSNYSDLSSKLTKVYGTGEEGINEEGLRTMIWYGAEKSCVLLYSVDGESADLLYGRLDAEDLFKASEMSPIDAVVDPDDISGL